LSKVSQMLTLDCSAVVDCGRTVVYRPPHSQILHCKAIHLYVHTRIPQLSSKCLRVTVKRWRRLLYEMHCHCCCHLSFMTSAALLPWQPVWRFQLTRGRYWHAYRFYLATRMHSANYAVAKCPCLSLCLSVRLSHAGIESKRLHLSSIFFTIG